MSKMFLSFVIFLSWQVFGAINNSDFRLKTNQSMYSRKSLNTKKNLGHNNAPNSYLLKKGSYTIGPYVLAYGALDELSVGVSTWLYFDYNMNNIFIRTNKELNSEWVVFLQSLYLETYEVKKTHFAEGYQMRSLRNHLTLTQFISGELSIHYVLGYEYFWEETFSHSFRREPLTNDPWQINSSVMFENSASNGSYLQLEFGILGGNYLYPQMIFAGSVGKRFQDSGLQFGLALSGTPRAFVGKKIDTNFYPGEPTKERMKNDFSIHPELQWQFYF